MGCLVSSDAIVGAIKPGITFLSQSYYLVFYRLELIWIDLNNTSEVDKQCYSCIDFEIEVRGSEGACQKHTMN